MTQCTTWTAPHATETTKPRSAALRRVLHVLSLVMAVAVALPVAEGVIRVRNSSMRNYQIEMWRYSKELKQQSANPVLGHEHVRNRSAVLQSVNVRLNEYGMRGGPVGSCKPGVRRILLLGSSITLGWGVPEAETLSARLREMFERDGCEVEVLNAGIGNYNTVRYVELFLTRLTELEPTDIIVHYFINDAEVLEPGGGNFLLEHSQLAATLWTLAKQHAVGTGERGLDAHYRKVYESDSPGFLAMKGALRRLHEYAEAHGIRLHLAVIPDIHNLRDYQFGYIHDALREIAREVGYHFVDLYPAFAGLTPEDIWSMPGDPHPNARGHRIMADTLYPTLLEPPETPQHAASEPPPHAYADRENS